VKVTVNGTLLPAGIVVGKVIPLKEYPDPLQLAEETLILDPAALRVPVWCWLFPTSMLPKFIAEGLTDSWAAAGWGFDAAEVVYPPPQEVASTPAKKVAKSTRKGLRASALLMFPLYLRTCADRSRTKHAHWDRACYLSRTRTVSGEIVPDTADLW